MMAITLFLDRDHAKARDNPAAGLGKMPAEIANHGHHALFDRDGAKTNSQPAWEKFSGNRQ